MKKAKSKKAKAKSKATRKNPGRSSMSSEEPDREPEELAGDQANPNCTCGDVLDEHGNDPDYPGSTACNVDGCDCCAFERAS